MVVYNQETFSDAGSAAKRSKFTRLDYYENRIPEAFDVIYGQLDSESPDISKVKDTADKEFYRLKRIAAGRGGGTLQEKVDAANYIYDEIKNKRPDFVSKIFDHITSQIDPRRTQIVHVPLQVKEAIYDAKQAEAKKNNSKPDIKELDTNTLALITSLRLADDLQAMAQKKGYNHLTFSNDLLIVKKSISIDKRGDADIIGRFVIQPKYDVSQFNEGDLVFVADDSVQAGGVGAAIITALKRRDCHVLGVAALTCLPESTKLVAIPQVRGGLTQVFRLCFEVKYPSTHYTNSDERQYRTDMQDALHQVGLSIESLTNREILMIMSLMLDKNNAEHREFFDRMKKIAGVDPNIVEGNDAIVLSDGVMTPKQFGDQIKQRIQDLVKQQAFDSKSDAVKEGRGR